MKEKTGFLSHFRPSKREARYCLAHACHVSLNQTDPIKVRS